MGNVQKKGPWVPFLSQIKGVKMKKAAMSLLATFLLMTGLLPISVCANQDDVEHIPLSDEIEAIDGYIGSGWDDAFKKTVKMGVYDADIYIKHDGENLCFAMIIKTMVRYPSQLQFRAYVFYDNGDGVQWSTGDNIVIVPATGTRETAGIDYHYLQTWHFDLDTKLGGTENAVGCGRWDPTRGAYVFEICIAMNSRDPHDVNFEPCDTVMTKFGFDVIHLATGKFVDEGYTEPPEPIHPVPEPITDFPFLYPVKFICGTMEQWGEGPLAFGNYATAINVHNFTERSIKAVKKVVLTFPPGGQEPGEITRFYEFELGPDQALEIDCYDIRKMVGIEYPDFIKGFVVILSSDELDVVAVYTVATTTMTSIDVEYIETRKVE